MDTRETVARRINPFILGLAEFCETFWKAHVDILIGTQPDIDGSYVLAIDGVGRILFEPAPETGTGNGAIGDSAAPAGKSDAGTADRYGPASGNSLLSRIRLALVMHRFEEFYGQESGRGLCDAIRTGVLSAIEGIDGADVADQLRA